MHENESQIGEKQQDLNFSGWEETVEKINNLKNIAGGNASGALFGDSFNEDQKKILLAEAKHILEENQKNGAKIDTRDMYSSVKAPSLL
ncbi:MAG TPA: hypothetical protein VF185_00815 [Patescibacteria group bacterium]